MYSFVCLVFSIGNNFDELISIMDLITLFVSRKTIKKSQQTLLHFIMYLELLFYFIIPLYSDFEVDLNELYNPTYINMNDTQKFQPLIKYLPSQSIRVFFPKNVTRDEI